MSPKVTQGGQKHVIKHNGHNMKSVSHLKMGYLINLSQCRHRVSASKWCILTANTLNQLISFLLSFTVRQSHTQTQKVHMLNPCEHL